MWKERRNSNRMRVKHRNSKIDVTGGNLKVLSRRFGQYRFLVKDKMLKKTWLWTYFYILTLWYFYPLSWGFLCLYSRLNNNNLVVWILKTQSNNISKDLWSKVKDMKTVVPGHCFSNTWCDQLPGVELIGIKSCLVRETVGSQKRKNQKRWFYRHGGEEILK